MPKVPSQFEFFAPAISRKTKTNDWGCQQGHQSMIRTDPHTMLLLKGGRTLCMPMGGTTRQAPQAHLPVPSGTAPTCRRTAPRCTAGPGSASRPACSASPACAPRAPARSPGPPLLAGDPPADDVQPIVRIPSPTNTGRTERQRVWTGVPGFILKGGQMKQRKRSGT